MTFMLRRTPRGVCVQRQRSRHDKRSKVMLTNVFVRAALFKRWIDSDSVRFDYPFVYSEVRRRGVALLDLHERPDAGAAAC